MRNSQTTLRFWLALPELCKAATCPGSGGRQQRHKATEIICSESGPASSNKIHLGLVHPCSATALALSQQGHSLFATFSPKHIYVQTEALTPPAGDLPWLCTGAQEAQNTGWLAQVGDCFRMLLRRMEWKRPSKLLCAEIPTPAQVTAFEEFCSLFPQTENNVNSMECNLSSSSKLKHFSTYSCKDLESRSV